MKNKFGKGESAGDHNYPKGESTLGGNHMEKEKAGVATGLASRSDCDVKNYGPSYDERENPNTGNATERPQPYSPHSVSEKGKTFEIC